MATTKPQKQKLPLQMQDDFAKKVESEFNKMIMNHVPGGKD